MDRPRALVLAVLAVDGVLSALLGVFFLPAYIGTVPMPVSALLAGLLNTALVWAALQLTTSPPLAALPLLTFLLTVAVLSLGGPGDDVALRGPGILEFRVLILLAVGALPGAWLLTRRPPPAW